jgi:acetyl esterase/lipase
MIIVGTNELERPSCSPMRSGVTGGRLLMAVLALTACGESGTTGSTTSGSSDPVAASTTPSTSSTTDGGVVVVEDVPYRQSTSGDGTDSTVDIYVGDENEGGPLVVLLHGFGMSGPGQPDVDLGPLGEEVAKLGSTVFYFGWQTRSGLSADSTADLSCVGPFVAARAADFGADADNVIVVGHSMGAETGSMLALSSFDLAPSPDCTETGEASSPVAFVGIGGSYGMVGGPLDDAHTRFRSRSFPRGTFDEFDADEEIVPGLTAAQAYQLDGYRAIPPVTALDIVLVVGSKDQYPATNADITAAFAAALEASNVDVEVVIVNGANHEDVARPATRAGQATLRTLNDVLSNSR